MREIIVQNEIENLRIQEHNEKLEALENYKNNGIPKIEVAEYILEDLFKEKKGRWNNRKQTQQEIDDFIENDHIDRSLWKIGTKIEAKSPTKPTIIYPENAYNGLKLKSSEIKNQITEETLEQKQMKNFDIIVKNNFVNLGK